MAKQDHYRIFIERLETALKGKRFLESSWYSYAVLEDRLRSLLRSSGGELHAKTKKRISMMGPKLRELKERCPNDPLLSGEFTKELQDRLDSWKDERNELMHAMADASVPIEEIDRSAEALAKTGAKLVRDYCSLCRRIKKRLKSSTP